MSCFRVSALLILCTLLALGGCATRPVNAPIAEFRPNKGYQFETRRQDFKDRENLVTLAFSGGGTRAAAFSYGVGQRGPARIHQRVSRHTWMRIRSINGLHLCETAIDEQFRSRDVAAVVGCEKHDRLRDLVGRAEPSERDTVGNHLQALLAGL
jgi:hypothetical protein